ncbi:hypothetical protein EDB85DRAFT_1873220 [Lactarius pseudohatsudake]|nr:hypothetical protein EDB85DRAFT_1873220 [Lactarius pseudohatsudake]
MAPFSHRGVGLSTSLPLRKIPCRSPGCNRWFRNNAGLTKHMRTKHLVPPLSRQERPIPAPQLFDDAPDVPPPDFDPTMDRNVDEEEDGDGEGPEWEYHPALCATPCDEHGVYLPPGTPPPPPPIQSPDDWTPYRDRVEFELAEFLYKKVQMSGGSIDTLLQLWRASLINHGASPDEINLFDGRDSLYAVIDSTPIGDAVWQGFSLSYDGPRPNVIPQWMTTAYDVWHRDARQVLHNLLANPDFDCEFDYIPFREFDAKKRRRWQDFMSGDWAWREANRIAADPTTRGALLVPLILGSDKTTVSVATGQNEYYPLYLSIGNVRNNVRRAHRNAVVLLGFLAIPKTDKRHADDKEFRKFRRQLFHMSLAHILSSVRPAMTTPEVVRTPDGHFRRVVYSIGAYIADYPEQVLLACTVYGWCPRCIAHPDNLEVGGERRSRELTNALVNVLDLGMMWDQYGIVGSVTPFTSEFPRADIHDIIAPDILHQVVKGTFKDHLVSWVEDYLLLTYSKNNAKAILDDIDRRIALAPSFPGLRRFPQGRGFKQWTGDDSKALMKVYLPSLVGHVPPDVIRTFRAFLDFCYLVRRDMFNDDTLGLVQDALDRFHQFRTIFQTLGVRTDGFSLPRQHSLSHYRHLIRMFGAPNGLCSSITESKHIKAVKEPWRRSNRCNALGQMLIINQRLDKLAASRSNFESRRMLEGTVLTDTCEGAGLLADDEDNEGRSGGSANDEMNETHPVDDADVVSHVYLPVNRQRGYPMTTAGLAAVFDQQDFHDLIRRFLFDQLHLDDSDASSTEVPLTRCPPFDSSCKISVYHSMTAVFYSPSDPSGLRGMRSECIRSHPRWRKRTPRFDTVFVERDATLSGVRGLDVVRLRALFSFVWRGNYYPCALVRWFTHVADAPDEVTGMWVVRPDTNADGSPAVAVIHLDSVLRAAHLLPVFGNSLMPIDLSHYHSLDAFETYYINKYIDYHAFEIAS